jgi:predicted unusual protein kinase regulating ubiquinone biosynthesis (AarF/ABC1/UbiB family)
VQIGTEPKVNKKTYVPKPAAAPKFHPRARFLRSLSFFLGVVLHTYVWDIFLARFILFRWYVRKTGMQRWIKIARRFRVQAIEMGGMQIKLGQFLSSRADIIPDPVRHELAGLQDEVPPAPASHVLDLIMHEHGKSVDQLFQSFDQDSVAAASLGQVHYATLHDGREVAVKVQRPHIEEIINVDLRALKWIIHLIKNYPLVRRRADVQSLYEEFSRVLLRELDYVQEANNAEVIRNNFAGVEGVYIPYPIKELTTQRVLVMERIGGIKISDRASLDAAGIDRHELAERLNQTYLKQLFLDGFFHADPHPGNLFVHPAAGWKPGDSTTDLATYTNTNALVHSPNGTEPTSRGQPFTLIFVDFGMVSQLPPKTMENVLSAVLGLATNDAERIANALYDLKMFLPGVDKRVVVKMLNVMLKHTYDRSVQELNNMDVEQLFDETHDLVYDLPFQVPQNLLFLGRAISMVAGLATEIDPEINLFQSLYPFAHEMLDREQQKNWLEQAQAELTQMGEILLTLPRQMDEFYKVANRGELHTHADFGRMERMLRRVEQSTDRLTGGLVATGLFLGGVQLRMRGMDKDARRAWIAAALALMWSNWPRNNNNGRNSNGS